MSSIGKSERAELSSDLRLFLFIVALALALNLAIWI
jgi:hypothetical protein